MSFDIAPYAGAIEATSNFLGGILKRTFPEKMSELDAAKMQQEITMALMNGELQPLLAQINVNAAEAKSDSVFVAGWRPFIGWVCGAAFAYTFIIQPMAVFIIVSTEWAVPPLPSLDMMPMMTVLGGMLGIGAMRSYEKVQGAAAVKVGK